MPDWGIGSGVMISRSLLILVRGVATVVKVLMVLVANVAAVAVEGGPMSNA